MYDYLMVGPGLFGATFAHEAVRAGKRCLVIDRRGHLAGNAQEPAACGTGMEAGLER